MNLHVTKYMRERESNDNKLKEKGKVFRIKCRDGSNEKDFFNQSKSLFRLLPPDHFNTVDYEFSFYLCFARMN